MHDHANVIQYAKYGLLILVTGIISMMLITITTFSLISLLLTTEK